MTTILRSEHVAKGRLDAEAMDFHVRREETEGARGPIPVLVIDCQPMEWALAGRKAPLYGIALGEEAARELIAALTECL